MSGDPSPTPQGKNSSPQPSTGTKRKQDQDESPVAKQGNNDGEKKQKTLEGIIGSEKISNANEASHHPKNASSEILADEDRSNHTSKEDIEAGKANAKDSKDTRMNDADKPAEATAETSGEDNISQVEAQEPTDENSGEPANGAVDPDGRGNGTPSSILEKGIIYFFFRGRIGIDNASRIDEIARSYMVLRPLPHDAKLGDGKIGDAGNCRLIALPKKVLPRSGKDKFMVFVDNTEMSFEDLKGSFLSASDYETQTAGTRHTPAATPVGEGIYAITTTGQESHLAYILTIPFELDEVQRDMGLRKKGSFIASVKNPKYPSPPNASLPKAADYPNEIIDEFRSRRWMPLKPEHINYRNGQLLLIGEGDDGAEKATVPQPEDEKDGKETPLEEMEKLEDEDQIRVRHLKGDDAVFTDLQISSEDYPKLKSTW